MPIANTPDGRLDPAAQVAPDVLHAPAPTGKLRVGVYPGSPTSMARDRTTGVRVGVTAGGSSHATLSRELKNATVVRSVPAAVEMLAGGKVDGRRVRACWTDDGG